jgi:hypothetical protein
LSFPCPSLASSDPDEIVEAGWTPDPLQSKDTAVFSTITPKQVKKQSLDIEAKGSSPKALNEPLVEVKEGDKEVKAKPADVPFSRLLAYNKPEVWWIFIGFIGAGMCGVVQPSFAFVISDLITTLFAPAVSVLGSKQRANL